MFRYLSFLIITLCGIISANICFGQNHESPGRKIEDFYVLTIPKSGSHLIMRALSLLTKRESVNPSATFPQMDPFKFHDEIKGFYINDSDLEDYFFTTRVKNVFVLAHFNFAESASRFSIYHPEYVKIIQIRDLRDVCVSWAHFLLDMIEREIGPSTLEERIMYIIRLGNRETRVPLLNIYKNAVKAAQWVHDPEVIVCRFEDLVGSKGGGSDEAQAAMMKKLAYRLNVDLTDAEISEMAIQLFGHKWYSPSFREGQIGSWKSVFTEEHKIAFEECLGELQVALGYDLDW